MALKRGVHERQADYHDDMAWLHEEKIDAKFGMKGPGKGSRDLDVLARRAHVDAAEWHRVASATAAVRHAKTAAKAWDLTLRADELSRRAGVVPGRNPRSRGALTQRETEIFRRSLVSLLEDAFAVHDLLIHNKAVDGDLLGTLQVNAGVVAKLAGKARGT